MNLEVEWASPSPLSRPPAVVRKVSRDTRLTSSRPHFRSLGQRRPCPCAVVSLQVTDVRCPTHLLAHISKTRRYWSPLTCVWLIRHGRHEPLQGLVPEVAAAGTRSEPDYECAFADSNCSIDTLTYTYIGLPWKSISSTRSASNGSVFAGHPDYLFPLFTPAVPRRTHYTLFNRFSRKIARDFRGGSRVGKAVAVGTCVGGLKVR